MAERGCITCARFKAEADAWPCRACFFDHTHPLWVQTKRPLPRKDSRKTKPRQNLRPPPLDHALLAQRLERLGEAIGEVPEGTTREALFAVHNTLALLDEHLTLIEGRQRRRRYAQK